jgi:hypothetical protein
MKQMLPGHNMKRTSTDLLKQLKWLKMGIYMNKEKNKTRSVTFSLNVFGI